MKIAPSKSTLELKPKLYKRTCLSRINDILLYIYRIGNSATENIILCMIQGGTVLIRPGVVFLFIWHNLDCVASYSVLLKISIGIFRKFR